MREELEDQVFHLDRLSTDQRASVLWAILQSGVSVNAWNNLERPLTLYTDQYGRQIQTLSPFDGKSSQLLLPLLWVDELELSPEGIGAAQENVFDVLVDNAQQRQYPAFSSVLSIGGIHVTNDISIGLRTPLDSAEMIKKKSGCAVQAVLANEST